jgi:DNA-binding GntR family transcriptional regulator
MLKHRGLRGLYYQKLKTAAEKLHSQLTIFSNIYETQANAQKGINQMHISIYEAYKTKDFEKAGKLMKIHLDDSLEYALQLFQSSHNL